MAGAERGADARQAGPAKAQAGRWSRRAQRASLIKYYGLDPPSALHGDHLSHDLTSADARQRPADHG
jgi:hypothetical protein